MRRVRCISLTAGGAGGKMPANILRRPICADMFARFMPQEGKFFELFNAHAEQVAACSKTLLSFADRFQ